ncbi:hypothetical protein POM88_034366 [Heracleum sosnowskyi]|uniref:UDP-glucose 4-epimerase n=1 Tax=Heracleum sosnowskyi TaxID=360622 RepID=A0AAD8HJG5_9APIA|nr:hypothetical protein POM88_034366 [Heracleum sosnowskyi]
MSSTGVRGTVGYIPPEYGMCVEISAEGDVYSYGILLLEMFSGKRPTESSILMDNDKDLHDYSHSGRETSLIPRTIPSSLINGKQLSATLPPLSSTPGSGFSIPHNIGCIAYNLGTSYGTSVLKMVAAFEKASGKKIPVKLCAKRPGDATAVYASTEKTERELGWKAKYGVDEMCHNQWKCLILPLI